MAHKTATLWALLGANQGHAGLGQQGPPAIQQGATATSQGPEQRRHDWQQMGSGRHSNATASSPLVASHYRGASLKGAVALNSVRGILKLTSLRHESVSYHCNSNQRARCCGADLDSG